MGGEHDAFIKVIIVERIVKAIVLIALAVGLLVAGRTGALTGWANYAEEQLNLPAGHGLITQLLLRLIDYIGTFNHTTLLAVGRSSTRCSKAPRVLGSPCGGAGRST